MIRLGWCRNTINRNVSRVKAVFKWAPDEELLPASVYHGLLAVKGLQRGRCEARETEPVRPAPERLVTAILPLVNRQIGTIVQLQLLTGARGGELCAMRVRDVDGSGKVWFYRPEHHKTAHHCIARIIRFGKQCQQILAPFLDGKLNLDAYVFSPAEAEAERREKLAKNRETKVQPSQQRRHEWALRRRRRRAPGERYHSTEYRRAVQRACAAAFPPPEHLAQRDDESRAVWRKPLTKEQRAELRQWQREHRFHPHRLRHSAATRWLREHGRDATLTLLGDRTPKMINVYAEPDHATADQIMAEVG